MVETEEVEMEEGVKAAVVKVAAAKEAGEMAGAKAEAKAGG